MVSNQPCSSLVFSSLACIAFRVAEHHTAGLLLQAERRTAARAFGQRIAATQQAQGEGGLDGLCVALTAGVLTGHIVPATSLEEIVRPKKTL